MRFRSSAVALFALVTVAACSDSPATSPLRPYTGPGSQITLADFIQQSIDDFLPRGFEDAVEARWGTVKTKKNSGDFAGAVKYLNTLSLWIDRKTSDITPPAGMTQGQAAAMLVLNMARWVYDGADADPEIVPTGDATIEVVPAFTPLDMATPSQHAGIEWGATSSDVERIVIIVEDPTQYPGHCNGPLVTRRCQYPLFYRAESFPHTRLVNPGRFAVCMVTTGDRRPLDYVADEPNGPVDDRLRVAHDLPESSADYTFGATQEDGIEILPLTATPSGTVINCNAPSTASMNPVERALYAVSTFAAKFISPKNAFAYDQGPEHDFSFFSNFNAVDPASQPDLSVSGTTAPSQGAINTAVTVSYLVSNTSRRSGGAATGAAEATTATVYLSSNATYEASDIALGTFPIAMLRPDASIPVSQSVMLPATAGSYYLIAQVPMNPGYAGEITDANNWSATATPITVFDPVVFISGFEDGEPVFWSTDGFWSRNALGHTNAAFPTYVSTVGSVLPSPFEGTRSGWYGQPSTGNYIGTQVTDDVPLGGGRSTAVNTGMMKSANFAVPNVAGVIQLRFKTWWEIEGVNPRNFDLMDVIVQNATTGATLLVRRLNPTADPTSPTDRRALAYTSGGFNVAPTWEDVMVDLSAFKGMTVRLKFVFATGDVLYNGFRGWVVDQLSVRVLPLAMLASSTAEPGGAIVPADEMTFPTRAPEQP